jgi:hypothetical protein
MSIFRRFIPLLSAIVFIAGGLFMLSNRTYVLAISTTIIFVLLLCIVWFFWVRSLSFFDRWLFIITSVLFVVTGLAFFIFLEKPIAHYAFLLLIGIVLGVYLENAYHFIFLTERYEVSSVGNVSSYVHVLTIFFGTVALFDARFFFSLPLAYFLIIAFVFGYGSMFSLLWSQKFSRRTLWWYALILSSLYTQILLALSFWPHVPLVKGIVATAISYGILQASVHSMSGVLTFNKVMRLSVIVVCIIAITLVTAQWV